MSDGVYALGALITVLATVAGIWSAIRRQQLMRKILRSLTKEQREELEKHLKKNA